MTFYNRSKPKKAKNRIKNSFNNYETEYLLKSQDLTGETKSSC